jgi:hypothetical protein
MERHLKHIRIQKVDPKNDNFVINADEHQETLKQLFEDEKVRQLENEKFIKGVENDLQEYDRMILEEVKTELEAVNLKRLLTGRQKMLFEAKKDCEGEELDRYEDAIIKSNLLLTELDCKLIEIKALEQPTPGPEQVRIYNYDSEMVARVYDYCIETKVFYCPFWVFVKCIDTANFKKLYPKSNDKNKIKHLIYQLKKEDVGKIGEVWYTNTAKSIGIDKKRFTGFDLSDDWTHGLLLEICPKNQQKKY